MTFDEQKMAIKIWQNLSTYNECYMYRFGFDKRISMDLTLFGVYDIIISNIKQALNGNRHLISFPHYLPKLGPFKITNSGHLIYLTNLNISHYQDEFRNSDNFTVTVFYKRVIYSCKVTEYV